LNLETQVPPSTPPYVPASPEPRPPIHWASAAQFGLSLFAIALLLGGSLFLLILGVVGAITAPETSGDLLALLLMTATAFSLGLLLVPSAYYGLMRLLGKPAFDSLPLLRRIRPAWLLMLFPIVLLVGFLASQTQLTSWLILPALHLFGVGLPVACLVSLAVKGLPLGSSQRMWGVFNSGLVLGPAVISILEGLAIGAGIIAIGVYISTQPDLMDQLMEIVETARFSQPSQDELLDTFSPYILRPGVIFTVLAMGAVIVPLIEEALKPMGVWLLAGRRLSVPAGFAAGALSGAGFALSESMLLSSNGADWASLILVRIGTGAIHILTTALMGWALALAWKQRRFARLALAYLAAVLIHALWNGLTIALAFAQAAQSIPGSSQLWFGLLVGAPVGLLLLAAGAVFLLARFNRRLKARFKTTPPAVPLEV